MLCPLLVTLLLFPSPAITRRIPAGHPPLRISPSRGMLAPSGNRLVFAGKPLQSSWTPVTEPLPTFERKEVTDELPG